MARAFWAGVLGLSFPLMLFGAALPRPWLFVAGAAASYLADWYLHARFAYLVRALSKVHLGITLRYLVRDALLVVLVARVGHIGDTGFVLFCLGVFMLHGLRGMQTTLTYRIQRRRSPIELINVDPPAELLEGPPRWLVQDGIRRMLHLDLLFVAGALVGTLTHDYRLLAALLALALFVAIAAIVLLYWFYLRLLRCSAEDTFDLLHEQLVAGRPEVLLYFSGSTQSAYQINMWLAVLEALNQNVLIILRERGMMRLVGETTTPIACIVNPVDLMNCSLPDVRLALYVANVGKNIHLLRVPGIQHVFIGHGDSDKQASVNPFSKVYDEVWVAGPAGRDRWARADAGVRDENIREVGRPQLDSIEVVGETGAKVINRVLYAPTWEGWTNDPFHTSLVLLGPEIVREILSDNPSVALTYKPHPLTGTRDPKAKRAHQEIVRIIQAANRDRAPDAMHEVVTGPAPTLFECFNTADLLVSDISSVVADFIHSQKPYVVTNSGGVPGAEFKADNPTASAAYLVGPSDTSISEVLRAVSTADPLAADRRRLKDYLLGPDEPPSMERFKQAVDELVAQGIPAPTPGELEFTFEPEPDPESAAVAEGEGGDGGEPRLAVG